MAMTPIYVLILLTAESQASVPGLFLEQPTDDQTAVADGGENMLRYTDVYMLPEAQLRVGSGAGYPLTTSEVPFHGLSTTTTRNGQDDDPKQSLEQSDPTGRIRCFRLPLPMPQVLAKLTNWMGLFKQDIPIKPISFAERTLGRPSCWRQVLYRTFR